MQRILDNQNLVFLESRSSFYLLLFYLSKFYLMNAPLLRTRGFESPLFIPTPVGFVRMCALFRALLYLVHHSLLDNRADA